MKVLYFAKTRELLEKSYETIDLTNEQDITTIKDLVDYLLKKYTNINGFKEIVSVSSISVNEEIQQDLDYTINNSDTIAIISPVSGG